VLRELVERGYDVTILHTGRHEPDEPILAEVEHIHADPHFRETLTEAVAGRDFEVVLAMYGRMVLNVEIFTGRCDRFISVGGNPGHRGSLNRRTNVPEGMQLLANETSPTTTESATSRDRFGLKIAEAERAVFAVHDAGGFSATHLRYPIIYGTRSIAWFERWAVRRLTNGHRRLLVPDGGLSVFSQSAARNAAHAIGLVLDAPDVAGGQLYQCADDRQFSVAQWLELIADHLGASIEIVSAPLELARPVWPYLPLGPLATRHSLIDTSKIRRELGYADVVDPVDALGEMVDHLAASPELLTSTEDDPDGEAAVIATMDRARAELIAALNWQPLVDEPNWHPYAHPKAPDGGSAH
jgi:nucleoside-diphosphate-sugar epimerase